MSTPEGAVKNLVRRLLAKYNIQPASKAGTYERSAGYYHFAVQGMLSVKGIPDIVGHYLGRAFYLEIKAPGKKPTGLQSLQIAAIAASGGAVFVVDGVESLKIFEVWLKGQE